MEEIDKGAVALVPFPEYSECSGGYFVRQRRVLFKGCVADLSQTITAILRGSKWSVLLLLMVMQDATWEVLDVCPQLNFEVYVDDM